MNRFIIFGLFDEINHCFLTKGLILIKGFDFVQ